MEVLSNGTSLRSESHQDDVSQSVEETMSLPKKVQPPIVEVRNATIETERDVGVFSQAGANYPERIILEIRNNLSWFIIVSTSVVGFMFSYSLILTIIIGLISCGIYCYLSIDQEEDRIRLTQKLLDESEERKKDFLKRMNLKHLLRKLHHTNEGSCNWMNELIARFWPFVNPLIQKEIDQRGLSKKGSGIEFGGSKIKFDRLTLGDRPPSLSHITVIKGNRDDELILDCRLLYYGNCLLSFSRKALKIFEMKIGLKDIYFQANARITLRPLLAEPPILGGMVISLTEAPLVDFEGFNLGSLADNRIIKNIIITVISGLLVQPNKISVAFTKKTTKEVAFPSPKGVCYFEVIEVADLPPLHDIILIKKGIFCIVRVGETYFQTPLAKSNPSTPDGNPNRSVGWSYKQVAPFHDYIDMFSIEVIDKDTSSPSNHASLGSVQFQLSSILGPKTNGHSHWLPLGHSKTGRIHFRVALLDLTYNSLQAKDQVKQIRTTIPSHIPTGLLSIYLHEIRACPGKALAENEWPFAMLKFAGQTFTSHVLRGASLVKKPQALNQSCHFVLNQEKDDELLHIVIIDGHKISASHVTKPEYKPLRDHVIAMRSIKLTDVLDLEKMSFDKTINLYYNDVPVVKMSIFVGISLIKYQPHVFNNLRANQPTSSQLFPSLSSINTSESKQSNEI